MNRPNVFISYSHDSEGHTERVRGLAAGLERDGCTCHLDIHKNTDEDWPTWMTRQLIEADIVLCVATETYEKRFRDRELPDVGLGVGWEAGLIRRLLYTKKLHNSHIFPVFFDPADRRHIPLELQGHDHFPLDGPDGYESLLRKILNRPLYKGPESGSAPDLPTHTTEPLFSRPGEPASGESPSVARLDETDGAEPADEYATETDNPLVKILDHTDQLPTIRDLLKDNDNDRAVALVEACSKDWPSYLADHVHLKFGPKHNRDLQGAVSLRLIGSDGAAFWEALLEAIPGASGAPDEEAKRAVIRGWINGVDLRVLYFSVGLKRYGRDLPKIIRSADETFKKLGIRSGSRVLLIIACLRNEPDKTPFWWPWYARFKLAKLERCHRLAAMRPLEEVDIENWYDGFPDPLRTYYDRDQLKAELRALFDSGCAGIRYEQARNCLIGEEKKVDGKTVKDEGALQRARRNPCP